MTYRLYLDDERPCPDGWVLAKDFWEFKRILKEQGIPTEVSFDYVLLSPRGRRYSGLDCAEYLLHRCISTDTPVPPYTVHSAHEDAQRLIDKLFKDFRDDKSHLL